MVHGAPTNYHSGPLRLFEWTACLGDDQGASGVTDDEQRAVEHLAEALADAAPGSSGSVHRAHYAGGGVGYRHGHQVAQAEVTADGVTWT
ncbi:hypothetical protein DPM19_09895 [Actinomadura craniellae]|uniref:Uncharacterized protein n=1 Tax=Actinomadura craniellae TaxID=2231787 RepID=A0A365H7V0_9ACTN|nr:hypothetical protein [Actinomadura craniellae]RAY15046.1 hypothetical protein DPM19_09895 [Actinomadura craniellae]